MGFKFRYRRKVKGSLLHTQSSHVSIWKSIKICCPDVDEKKITDLCLNDSMNLLFWNTIECHLYDVRLLKVTFALCVLLFQPFQKHLIQNKRIRSLFFSILKNQDPRNLRLKNSLLKYYISYKKKKKRKLKTTWVEQVTIRTSPWSWNRKCYHYTKPSFLLVLHWSWLFVYM